MALYLGGVQKNGCSRFPRDNISTEFGGSEMDVRGSVVFAEELGKSTFSGFAIASLVHTDMASVHLLNAGNLEQKKKYLSDIVSGNKISCVAVTEPNAGSDVKNIRTKAQKLEANISLMDLRFLLLTVCTLTYIS